MAGTTVIAAKLTLDPTQPVQSVKSFKQQLKEAQVELLNMQQSFGDLSPEAIKAARRVAELRDRIQEAREVAELFDPGKKFQAFAGALSTVAAGYGAVQGAMGLFGAESKELEKQLLKVQSAMALAQGLSAIADGAKDFQRLGVIAKEALAGIRTGILATGIGALVVAVGTLIAYWDDIREAVTGVSAADRENLKVTQEIVDKEKDRLKHIGDQDDILRLQGKSEREILEIKIKQIEATLEAQRVALQAIEDVGKKQVEAAVGTYTKVKTFFAATPLNSLADWLFDPTETVKKTKETTKAAKDGYNESLNQLAQFKLQIKDINKKAAEDERNFQKQLRDIRQQADNVFVKDTSLLAKEKLDQDNKYAIDAINAQQISQKQKHKLLLEQERLYNNQLTDLKNEDDKTKFIAETDAAQKRIDAKKAEIDQLLAWQKDANAKQIEDEQNYAEARKQIREAELEHQRFITDSVATLLDIAADQAGKNTTAGKVLAIAAASISTYLSAQKAYESQFLPIPDISSPIRGALAAGVAIASGLASIRRIVSVQVPRGGGGGSAPSMGGSMPAPMTPRPTVMNTMLPQDQVNAMGNSAVRAYVIESDVTNSQEKITRLNRQARLGG